MNHVGGADAWITVTEVRLHDGAVLVAVTGELDIGTTAAFHYQLSEILDSCDGRRLELDLSALDFCDLTGLRALHALGRACAQVRRPVRITAPGPGLDALLHLCRASVLLDYTPPPGSPEDG